MQIMQIFQSKYDFVTSKRFNNKIKEYEKLGFVITNSVIDDCNLAYLDQVLLWLNPTRYLSYVDGYLFYVDDANQKYCIKSNGAYQLFGKYQFLRPFAFIKDVLGFTEYQTYYILHIFLKKVSKTDIANLLKATYPLLKPDIPINADCLNHYKELKPSKDGLAKLYGVYKYKHHIDHNLLSTMMFNRFITLDEQGNIYYPTSYNDKVVSVYNLSAGELYCSDRSVGSFFAEHPASKSMDEVKRLFVFTDILDMLSFITLYRKNLFSSFKIFKSQTGYLSLNGNNYDEFVRFIKQHPNIKSVFDCTKNQGYSFIRKIKEYGDDANIAITPVDNLSAEEAELQEHLEHQFYASGRYNQYRIESRFKNKLKKCLGENIFFWDLHDILKNYDCDGCGAVSWQAILQKEYAKGSITNEVRILLPDAIDQFIISKRLEKKVTATQGTETQTLNADSIKVGDTVKHNKYGEGCVKEITDNMVIISFGVEEKKFPFPMAFDNKFLFRCENAPPTPVVEIAESYIPTGIDDPNLPDDYLPF